MIKNIEKTPTDLLTEDEEIYIKEQYKNGITNVTSLVALLYSRGNTKDFTPLRKNVAHLLGIREVFKSIASSLAETDLKKEDEK